MNPKPPSFLQPQRHSKEVRAPSPGRTRTPLPIHDSLRAIACMTQAPRLWPTPHASQGPEEKQRRSCGTTTPILFSYEQLETTGTFFQARTTWHKKPPEEGLHLKAVALWPVAPSQSRNLIVDPNT